jgi:oligoendopeptidase F
VQKVYLDLDRSRREKAWRLEMGRKLADRDQINALWCRMLELRRSIALQAGEADYRAYRWKEMLRFDYTPDDCLRFHQAIEQVVVPAATRIYEKRRQRLGSKHCARGI